MMIAVFAAFILVYIAACHFLLFRARPLIAEIELEASKQKKLLEIAQDPFGNAADESGGTEQDGQGLTTTREYLSKKTTITVADTENMSRNQAYALKQRIKREKLIANLGQVSRTAELVASNNLGALPRPPRFPVSEAVQQLKVVIIFVQLGTHLALNLDIPWPNSYRAFISAFDFINMDVLPWAGASCVTKIGFFATLSFMVLVPVGFIAATILFFSLRRRQGDIHAYRKARKISFWATYLIYMRVSSQCFEMFNCTEVEGVSFITSDFSVRCYDGQWYKWLAINCVFIILIPFGVPAMVFWSMYRKRHKLNSAVARYEMDFLYASFTPTKWWFEIADCMHKLSIATIVALPSEYQLRIAMLIVVVYYYVLLL